MSKDKLLLLSCCAPCSVGVIEDLKKQLEGAEAEKEDLANKLKNRLQRINELLLKIYRAVSFNVFS